MKRKRQFFLYILFDVPTIPEMSSFDLRLYHCCQFPDLQILLGFRYIRDMKSDRSWLYRPYCLSSDYHKSDLVLQLSSREKEIIFRVFLAHFLASICL